jgi:hypothetical protein
MANWFDDHVIVIGIGDVDTDKIKTQIEGGK